MGIDWPDSPGHPRNRSELDFPSEYMIYQPVLVMAWVSSTPEVKADLTRSVTNQIKNKYSVETFVISPE